MRVLIVGAGGVGAYFGARLALDGNDVMFVARGAHREAMEREGLKVHSPLGDMHLPTPQLYENAEQAGLFDFVLVCTKLWDSESVADLIRPLLAHDTAVISVQNGIDAEPLFARLLGAKHVMGGIAQISAHIEAPGVVRHHSETARFVFGEMDGSKSWRQETLQAACESAGLEAIVRDDIEVALWEKFVALAPSAGACAYYRASIGEVHGDLERSATLKALIREALAVARAKGIPFEEGREDTFFKRIGTLPGTIKPSMLVDLERGNRLELDWLLGAVVRLGEELGVDTPLSREVYTALQPHALGRAASG